MFDLTNFMNLDILHTATFWCLYAGLALATFVNIERAIFFWRTARVSRRLLAAMPYGRAHADATLGELIGQPSVPGNAVREMLTWNDSSRTHAEGEDAAEAIFIAARSQFRRHLWILDTIITAAPLLGLLGTILGIIDTFVTLAQSGISDPAGVSAGIGTALFATALGISVALYGLLFHNIFNERISRASDDLKILLIRSGRLRPAMQPASAREDGVVGSSLQAVSA
jgi:biopolymer transport protein ExbB